MFHKKSSYNVYKMSATLLKKTLAQVFSCEFREIFKLLEEKKALLIRWLLLP